MKASLVYLEGGDCLSLLLPYSRFCDFFPDSFDPRPRSVLDVCALEMTETVSHPRPEIAPSGLCYFRGKASPWQQCVGEGWSLGSQLQ